MATGTFKASVQYGDLRGTGSADRADQNDAEEWLKKKRLKKEGEYVLGVQLFAGENHGEHKDPIYVTFLLTTGGHDKVKSEIDPSDPIKVRLVSVEMPVADFFGLFKRVSICLSDHGMLDGRDYRYEE